MKTLRTIAAVIVAVVLVFGPTIAFAAGETVTVTTGAPTYAGQSTIQVTGTVTPAPTVSNTAVVGVRPVPHIIAGQLSPDDQRGVFEWISLNVGALVSYWEGRIDTVQLGQALKRIPSGNLGAPSVP
jgi:heme/copper-type cytochrome/quinol oxidase subunit 2